MPRQESAAKLCRSDGAVIFQLQEGVYRFAAGYSLITRISRNRTARTNFTGTGDTHWALPP